MTTTEDRKHKDTLTLLLILQRVREPVTYGKWWSHKAGPQLRYINLNQRVSRSHFSCFFNERGFIVLASLPKILILGIEQKSLNHQCKSPSRQITDPLCPLYWYGHQREVLSTNPSSSGWIFAYRMSEVITNTTQPLTICCICNSGKLQSPHGKCENLFIDNRKGVQLFVCDMHRYHYLVDLAAANIHKSITKFECRVLPKF